MDLSLLTFLWNNLILNIDIVYKCIYTFKGNNNKHVIQMK